MTGFHGLHVIGGLAVHGRGRCGHRRAHVARAGALDARGLRVLLALRRRGVDRDVLDDLRAEMSASRRARRQSLAAVAVVLAVTAVLLATASADGRRRRPRATRPRSAQGQALYFTGCVSCHGADGKGVVTADGEVRGPSLVSAGRGRRVLPAVDRPHAAGRSRRRSRFGSGRRTTTTRSRRWSRTSDRSATARSCPPSTSTEADVAAGGELFRANCAPCHSASGAGGALSYGNAAPPLSQAQPLQVGAAVRSGPGQMPVFGPDVIDDKQLNDVAALRPVPAPSAGSRRRPDRPHRPGARRVRRVVLRHGRARRPRGVDRDPLAAAAPIGT